MSFRDPPRCSSSVVNPPTYHQVLKLIQMLKSAEIPFEAESVFDGWNVIYPASDTEKLVIAEHQFSYGNKNDLLEVSDTAADEMFGFIDAETVFKAIAADWSFVNRRMTCTPIAN